MTGWHYQTERHTWEPCSARLAANLTANDNPDPGYEYGIVMWIDTTLSPSTASVARERVERETKP